MGAVGAALLLLGGAAGYLATFYALGAGRCVHWIIDDVKASAHSDDAAAAATDAAQWTIYASVLDGLWLGIALCKALQFVIGHAWAVVRTQCYRDKYS